ncbi:MAG TPA: MerR family transcriptional regulator [Rhizomicrobium sp.]|jgi:DNA-binding transcriptional MerR regulator
MALAAQVMKSPEAFRTISEVSTELDVPQHVLRFWEQRFSQVKPIKRAGGRRYYRPEDVDLLRGIRSLLYSDGYTIRGVQKLFREQGVRFVATRGRELRGVALPPIRESEDEPRYARAALALVERAHAEEFSGAGALPLLTEPNREKLELLLADLLQMKTRLKSARPSALS